MNENPGIKDINLDSLDQIYLKFFVKLTVSM